MVVAIDAVSAFWAARNLLVRLEKMVIYVNTERSLSSESFFNLILFILQVSFKEQLLVLVLKRIDQPKN